MIVAKEAPLWRRLLRRSKFSVILYDWQDPMNVRLPHKLEVGDSINQFLKYGPEFAVFPDTTHIGFVDSFGRYHWAPRRDVRQFLEKYEKAFPMVMARHMAERNKSTEKGTSTETEAQD
jgi:hypothetical protein